MAGKHIPALMLISSLLLLLAALIISSVVSSSLSSEYQTLVPTLLPSRQTESEALSWDTQSQSQSQSQAESELSESQYSSTSSRPSFSLKLQHVDNLSPPDTIPQSLFIYRLQRDAKRVFAITKSRTSASGDFSSPGVISGLQWGSGEYFTRIAVGSPSRNFYMTMDTASSIIWLQCLPCKNCYKQDGPVFNPKTSSSFHGGIPCKSKICPMDTFGYCNNLKNCAYNVSYGDGSFSKGEIATETLTFGKKTEVRNVTLGCGHDNEGLFVGAAGLIGLARDKQLSFVAQAGNKFGNKFSYCLANRWPWPNSSNKSSSYLTFGDSSACGKAVYTPLVNNPIPELNIYYYVGLERISVGGSRVQGINASMFGFDPKTGEGGVIVDSGTVVTRLPNHAYLALRDAFRNATYKHLKPAASKYDIFDTCYDLSGMSEVKVPTVELHFAGGNVSMSLPAANLMVPVDNKKTYCFAFAGTAESNGGSIIGNIQQQGFGVVFDLHNNQVGFAANAC